MKHQEVGSFQYFGPSLIRVHRWYDNIAVAVDWTSVQLKTFSVACSIIFEPLDQQAIEKAVDTASCESSGKDSSDNIYSFPDIYTLENETPPKMTPVPTSLNFDTTFVYGFSPTSSTGSSAIVVPIASTATVSYSHITPTLTVSILTWLIFTARCDVFLRNTYSSGYPCTCIRKSQYHIIKKDSNVFWISQLAQPVLTLANRRLQQPQHQPAQQEPRLRNSQRVQQWSKGQGLLILVFQCLLLQ
jgi:hypothetical protein